MYVDELLAQPRFLGVTLGDVERVVENDDRKRFAFSKEPGTLRLLIRANQGHSVKVIKMSRFRYSECYSYLV